MLKSGYVHKDDFFGGCLKDIQVQAILEEISFKYTDPKSTKEITETIRQSLYRLDAEMQAVVSWLEVVKFFSCPQYKIEGGLKVTHWKYIADNQLIDEKGILNRELRGVDHGLQSFNKSLALEKIQPVVSQRAGPLPELTSHIKSEVAKSKQTAISKGTAASLTGSGSRLPPTTGNLHLLPQSKFLAGAAALPSYLQSQAFKDTDAYFSEKDYKEQMALLRQKAINKELTIPKAPSMMARDKKPSTLEKKTRDHFEQKKKEDEEQMKKQFRAQEVPMSSKTPMYDNIVRADREKSMQNRAMSKERTESTQKPFSFYEQDKTKVEKKKELGDNPPLEGTDFTFTYKSKDLPTFYAQADSLKVKEHETLEKKKQIKEEHKQKLIAESKLPPRLDNQEKKETIREKKVQAMVDQIKSNQTYAPRINPEVPDFNKLQSKFKEDLDKKKSTVPKTEPIPFNFDSRELEKEAKASEEESRKLAESKKAKEVVEKEKKDKVGAINTFLNRNYLPTEVRKEEAQRELVEKGREKIDELKKQSKFKNATDEELLREVKISDKERERLLKEVFTLDSLMKAAVFGGVQLPAAQGSKGEDKKPQKDETDNTLDKLWAAADAPENHQSSPSKVNPNPSNLNPGWGSIPEVPEGGNFDEQQNDQQPAEDNQKDGQDGGLDGIDKDHSAQQIDQEDEHKSFQGEKSVNIGTEGDNNAFQEEAAPEGEQLLPGQATLQKDPPVASVKTVNTVLTPAARLEGVSAQDHPGTGVSRETQQPGKILKSSQKEQDLSNNKAGIQQDISSKAKSQSDVPKLVNKPTSLVQQISSISPQQQPSPNIDQTLSTKLSTTAKPSQNQLEKETKTSNQDKRETAGIPPSPVIPLSSLELLGTGPLDQTSPQQTEIKVLFTGQRAKIEQKEIDPFRKTRRDEEIEKAKAKLNEKQKLVEETKKKEEEERKAKHEEARVKVKEKLITLDQDKPKQAEDLETKNNERRQAIKQADEEFRKVREEIEKHAKNKACLVEESSSF